MEMSTTHIGGQELPAQNTPPLKQRAISKTRRFNGMERTALSWDGVRKDQELWQEDANCMIYYYAQGSSQRSASLKVPFTAVEQSQSSYLLDQCLVVRAGNTPSPTSDSGYDSSKSSESSQRSKVYDLYLPAPPRLSREQAYTYHVTTRNYFAFLTGQALVGDKLGLALADLWERATQWQDREDTHSRLLDFCKKQGYLSLVDSPLYATAVLNLADRANLRDIWINAFTHCVGMHDRLTSTPELVALKNTTKALITRASLEMDLHIARVVKAVSTFLDDEFGAERLGLSKPARDHLDHFRSFLHAYYVDKLGYFPPQDNEPFNKRLWADICNDFQSLYDHLVDTKSDGDMTNTQTTMNGGVCVLQNVQAFDRLNGYDPLPHPLPLLPQVNSTSRSTETQRSLRSFKLGRSDTGPDRKMPSRVALALATNAFENELKARPIVHEYQRFERSKLEEKLNVAEARKVRWLLIYGALQMLISITKVPDGVEGGDKAKYPLCVLVDGCPLWDDQKLAAARRESGSSEDLPATPRNSECLSIHPDCEADNAQDYFSLNRRESSNAEDMTPAPLRISVPLPRASSIRSSVGALQRSVAGSFNRRNSRRGSSFATPQKMPSTSELPTLADVDVSDREEKSHSEALQSLEGMRPDTATLENFRSFDFGLHQLAEEPTEPVLENHQLDDIFGTDDFRPTNVPSLVDSQLQDAPTPLYSWMLPSDLVSSPIEENSPISTSSQSTSARSSYNEHCSSPATNRSSFTLSEPSTAKTSLDFDKGFSGFHLHEHHSKRTSYAQKQTNFGASCASLKSLNAGTYQPSGVPNTYQPSGMPRASLAPAVSKYASQQRWRDQSADSVQSAASSRYPTESRQADEIEEEEMRGRRRLRAFDGFSFDD